MTYIEQLHLDAIESKVHLSYRFGKGNAVAGTYKAASKSAEITEQIACEFAQWVDRNKFNIFNLSFKELFQEYIKSKENEK